MMFRAHPQCAVATSMSPLKYIIAGIIRVSVLLDSRIHQPFLVISAHIQNNADGDNADDHDRSEDCQAPLQEIIVDRVLLNLCRQRRQERKAAVVAEVACATFHIVNSQARCIALLRPPVQVVLKTVQRQMLILRCTASRNTLISSCVSNARLPASQSIIADVLRVSINVAVRVIANKTFVPETRC